MNRVAGMGAERLTCNTELEIAGYDDIHPVGLFGDPRRAVGTHRNDDLSHGADRERIGRQFPDDKIAELERSGVCISLEFHGSIVGISAPA